MLKRSLKLLALSLALASPIVSGDDAFIMMQSTTSTQNSGLFDYLLPRYSADGGTEVRVVAVGTGQALKNAANGNGDVLMVHAREAEEKFIADGHGIAREPVMYNEFVILGPNDDPAGVAAADGVDDALQRIAASQALFVSRGDDSGTHKREQQLWKAAGLKPDPAQQSWYKDSGSGMGRTISIAVELGAYTLSDRATWLAYAKRGVHGVVFEGDPRLFNQYSLIVINPERHPAVKLKLAQAFVDWMLSPVGQSAIANYRLGGEQLFYPNAGSDN